MAHLTRQPVEQKAAAPPTTAITLRETEVLSFLSAVQNGDKKIGFQQLLEVDLAVVFLKKNKPDSASLISFEGPLVTKEMRQAIIKVAELDRTIIGIRRGTAERTLESLSGTGCEIAQLVGAKFDSATLPLEANVLLRYTAACAGKNKSLAPYLLGREKVGENRNSSHSIKFIEALVKLAEVGQQVTAVMVAAKDIAALEQQLAIIGAARDHGLEPPTTGFNTKLFDLFGYQNVGALLEYAKGRGGDGGVKNATDALLELAKYEESSPFDGMQKMIADLAFLAAKNNNSISDKTGTHKIDGISRVVLNCLKSLKACESDGKNQQTIDDSNLLIAVKGFAAEALVARKLVEMGNLVTSLDDEIELPSGRIKEIDILAIRISKESGVRTRFAIEVKSSRCALEHSFNQNGNRQLVGLGRAAFHLSAIAALVVMEETLPNDQILSRLAKAVEACKEITGKDLVILNRNLKPFFGLAEKLKLSLS